MAVDEPRGGQAAAAVDAPAASPSPAPALADRDDAVVLDDQVAVAVLGAGGVDGGDRAAFDDGPHRPLGGQPHRVEDLLVARAAAQVAGQRLADLGVGRIRVARQQVVAGHDQPRRAEAALHRARLDEGLLDGVQLLALGQPLDGDDLAALGLPGEHEARAHELAVEVDRARAALALLAGVLGAREVEVVAQRHEQALALPDAVGLAQLAVDGQGQAHRCSSHAHASVRRRQDAERVAAVGGAAADVVDRRGGRRHQRAEALERRVGERPARPPTGPPRRARRRRRPRPRRRGSASGRPSRCTRTPRGARARWPARASTRR